MTTDPFTTAAYAEAGTLYAVDWDTPAHYDEEDRQEAEQFLRGAEWARDHLARQEVTDAEQAARFAVESKHHLHGTQCLCGFESHRARSRTEHIMTHYFDELTAAKEARHG